MDANEEGQRRDGGYDSTSGGSKRVIRGEDIDELYILSPYP